MSLLTSNILVVNSTRIVFVIENMNHIKHCWYIIVLTIQSL